MDSVHGPRPRPRSRRGLRTLLVAVLPLTVGGVAAPVAAQTPDDAELEAIRAMLPAGPEALVTTRDGRRHEGVVVRETDKAIELEINGSGLVIPMAQVVEIEPLPSLAERYLERRDSLTPGDTTARLALATWLRERRAFRLALRETNTVLALEPNNLEAAALRRWLELQIKLGLAERRPGGEDGDGAAGEDEGSERGHRNRQDPFPLLSGDEINTLRVFEIDLAAPPRFVIPRDTIDAFIDAYRDHPLMPATQIERDALRRAPRTRILELMFQIRAREFYDDVRVLEDPETFRLFRDDVHKRWLTNACATTDCHGGQEAGRLYLATRNASRDAVVYTNFVILDGFKLDDGTPLIDIQNPERSPLLQMGLPRNSSLRPHPEVPVAPGRRPWRQVFRDEDDRRFEEAVAWIRSLYQPRPDYPIAYAPPTPAEPREAPEKPVER